MFKSFVILTVLALLPVLTGCDPGSNSFSKREQPTDAPQVALLSSNDAEVLQ